jgi:hypothetical protein
MGISGKIMENPLICSMYGILTYICGWIILGNQRINLPSNRQGHAGSMLIWGRVISVPYYSLLEIVQV